MSDDAVKGAPKRRRCLKTSGTAAVGAAALAAPMVSRAQTTTLRFQSTWPAKDIFHEYAQDFAKKVNDMAGGRLKIEVLPSGSVVPAFQLLDAVNKGTLDGGHGVVAYHYGKNNALALWGSGPAFGMDPNMVLAWHNYGGGKALLAEVYAALTEGGGGKRRISPAGGRRPRWRRDGKELYYIAPGGVLVALSVSSGPRLDIGAPVPLFSVEPDIENYDVVPDGSRFLVSTPAQEVRESPIRVIVNWTAALEKGR